MVAAPGKIERPAQDRVKTDQRDAELLVRLLMIDGLVAVPVPAGEEEALRDLVRAREDLRGDLMRARHRLGKLLLRHDVRYDGAGDNWTRRHRDWLGKVTLAERGAQATLLDYLGAIDALVIRRGTVEAQISELVPSSPCVEEVARLRCRLAERQAVLGEHQLERGIEVLGDRAPAASLIEAPRAGVERGREEPRLPIAALAHFGDGALVQ